MRILVSKVNPQNSKTNKIPRFMVRENRYKWAFSEAISSYLFVNYPTFALLLSFLFKMINLTLSYFLWLCAGLPACNLSDVSLTGFSFISVKLTLCMRQIQYGYWHCISGDVLRDAIIIIPAHESYIYTDRETHKTTTCITQDTCKYIHNISFWPF